MTTRSRTGCMTCRRRKLKCDEGRPTCGQCLKASRVCEPSTGLTFRHQHNASMNAQASTSSSQSNPLNGFYNYRESFTKDTVWADLPRGDFTFHNITNPYEEPTEPVSPRVGRSMAYNQDPYSQQHAIQYRNDGNMQPASSLPNPDGLHALSQAIELKDPLQANSTPRPLSIHQSPYDNTFDQLRASASFSTPPIVAPNHSPLVDASIDPSLMSPPERHEPSSTAMTQTPQTTTSTQTPQSIADETSTSTHTGLGQKEATLLRHFSEIPGRWMDLYDLGAYFSSYVPVKARHHSLLRHAACAYAAKQIFLVNRKWAGLDNTLTRQPARDLYSDTTVDWEREGSFHYDQSLILLQQLMKSTARPPDLSTMLAGGEMATDIEGTDLATSEHESLRNEDALARLRSDDVVAASVILGVYEFMSNTGTAWSNHLSGTQGLLETAMMTAGPSSPGPFSVPPRLAVSQARKATFWQFARQDYLAAFINECRTRLDTENVAMWRKYGLLLKDDGSLMSAAEAARQNPGTGVPDDMISNTLVWLSSKLCNFIAQGEGFPAVPAGDRSQTSHLEKRPSKYAESQASLLEKWNTLRHEFQVWSSGLPSTFEASSTYKPEGDIFDKHERKMQLKGEKNREFKATWFPSSMCASTMQHYHMSQVLLVLNKPQEIAARPSALRGRFRSIMTIGEEAVYHCYQIVNISLSQPAPSARVHSVQPLFVAGHCFISLEEQQIVLNLLQGIENDLGWTTEYRIQDLKAEWKWDKTSSSSSSQQAMQR